MEKYYKRLGRSLSRKRQLQEIVEDPDEQLNEGLRQQSHSVIGKKVQKVKRQVAFFKHFLDQLRAYQEVYGYFIQLCRKVKVVDKKNVVRQTLKQDLIKQSISQPQINKRRQEKQQSYRTFDYRQNQKTQDQMSNTVEIKQNTKIVQQIKRSQSKQQFLFEKDQELKKRFKIIAQIDQESKQNQQTITQNSFQQYLLKRYPAQMVEKFLKYFDITKSMYYKDFHAMLENFLHQTSQKHFKFCFEAYDFNKDRKICHSDCFITIQLLDLSCSDQDLAVIKEALSQKKAQKRIRWNQLKRLTFNHSLIIEKPQITFKEFQALKFTHKKPQIFFDFVQYTTGFNPIKQTKTKSEPTLRRDSEVVIFDMDYNVELFQEVLNGRKYQYYTELKEIVNKYQYHDFENLIKKFKFLESNDFEDEKLITLESFQQHYVSYNQPKLIGTSARYFIERVYKVIAGPLYKDVNKLQFLTSIFPLIYGSKTEKYKWLFKIFDSQNDELITSSELIDMIKSFKKGNQAYNEVRGLLDVIHYSLLGKRRKEIIKINLSQFMQLLPNSIILQHVIQSFSSKELETSKFEGIEESNFNKERYRLI